MISLAYLLCYMFYGKITWIDLKMQWSSKFQKICEVKKAMTPQKLCAEEASWLLEFTKLVFNYSFEI